MFYYNIVLTRCKDNDQKWDGIDKGYLVFVSILKDTTEEMLDKNLKDFTNAKLFEPTSTNSDTKTKLTSLSEANCNLIVIPQASLAAKLKNKQTQYHSLIDKEKGEVLFQQFVAGVAQSTKGKVVCGTYGNRQGLKIDATSGPYSHFFSFE